MLDDPLSAHRYPVHAARVGPSNDRENVQALNLARGLALAKPRFLEFNRNKRSFTLARSYPPRELAVARLNERRLRRVN